jgi:hypothetical protein
MTDRGGGEEDHRWEELKSGSVEIRLKVTATVRWKAVGYTAHEYKSPLECVFGSMWCVHV